MNAWLANNGLRATPISPAGDWIAVQVPVNKANELLGAHFSVFNDEKTGHQVIRTLSYSIPAELKGHLDLVHPTTTSVMTLHAQRYLTDLWPTFRQLRRHPAACASDLTAPQVPYAGRL